MASRRIPHDTVDTDTQTTDRRLKVGKPREVLLVGELAINTRTQLLQRGAVLTAAVDTHEAFEFLAERDFGAVVVNPFAPGEGLDLVTALKE